LFKFLLKQKKLLKKYRKYSIIKIEILIQEFNSDTDFDNFKLFLLNTYALAIIYAIK
jgi:hypothetical protein